MTRHTHRFAAIARAKRELSLQPPPEPYDAVPSLGELLGGLAVAGLVAFAVVVPPLVLALMLLETLLYGVMVP